jgi:hypothetical protein
MKWPLARAEFLALIAGDYVTDRPPKGNAERLCAGALSFDVGTAISKACIRTTVAR